MININNTNNENINVDAEHPEWMDDELVKNIPAEKLNFLSRLFAGSQGKSQKEMMMYLMPLIKQAKKDNLTLTPEEMNAAVAAIKKHSTAQELEKINNILNK
jgi:hypothetical protein